MLMSFGKRFKKNMMCPILLMMIVFPPLPVVMNSHPLQPMQWQEHKCSSLSHSNPTKATNAIDRYERKNKVGNPQRTPRSRSKGSPHLEEKVIGKKVDLDLLSLFPKKDARNMGEWRREGKLSRSTM
jgi:hypothetical protein